MDATQFTDFQEGLVFVFGPWIPWILAVIVSGGVIASIVQLFLALARKISGTSYTTEGGD